MGLKVSELTGPLLDLWVAKAEGYETSPFKSGYWIRRDGDVVGFVGEKYTTTLWNYSPSTDWSQGGPIIEREKIKLEPIHALRGGEFRFWNAKAFKYVFPMDGETALIAAMRCFVASKFGEEAPDDK